MSYMDGPQFGVNRVQFSSYLDRAFLRFGEMNDGGATGNVPPLALSFRRATEGNAVVISATAGLGPDADGRTGDTAR